MLKNWKMLGAGLFLFLLAACATPRQSAPPEDASEPRPAPFLSYTNQLPVPRRPIETNVPPPATAPVPPPPAPVIKETVVKPPMAVAPLPATWVDAEAWTQALGWSRPERVRNASSWTYLVKSPKGTLELSAGNRRIVWNGLNLELAFPPRLTNGLPLLHGLDVSKTLMPLATDPNVLQRPGRIVVIDPGHGGENYGAKSALSARYEKEFALDWARRLEPLLTQRGWRVFFTRTNDVDVSLLDRIAYADAVQADLFVSLHFNSSDQPQAANDSGGIETYCLTPTGMPSSLTRNYEDEQTQVFPNNAFDADNFSLAVRLHRALVESTQRRDRGVRRARFMGVLKGQNRPAVLVEGGYLTCPSEARLIATAPFRQKLADAVAHALSN